jgi:hypothetical protein
MLESTADLPLQGNFGVKAVEHDKVMRGVVLLRLAALMA